jgi:diguanylate cyclase (GGDEF)-like protein
LHFGLHAWTPEEISTLQAIASMLVQLQARIDAEDRTEYIALHDDLTGLPNRRALVRELEDRLGAKRQTAVLFFDLDRFKVMNDFLGHASGDRVLTTIADRLRTSIRPGDFASRLGGDEFVVLLDDARSEMEVLATAYRILAILGEPIDFAGYHVSHTSSIGVVLSEPGSRNGMELLGWADVALYAAKRRGRNQAVVFDKELRMTVGERSMTELTLREAIEGVGLRLHYQPEVDLRTGELLAVEALVRWEHPTRGLLPAAAFITVAEETGLVVEMGRWVFEEACRQLAAWRWEYPDLNLIVRVNMSPTQFVIDGLVEFVENCLRVHQIPGESLCIEITEHAVLQEPEQTARILRGFPALGVEIALDDFGTGYASMTELKRLPVNFLKLDQSFVSGITTDPSDRAIVEAIIKLGHALHLDLIAEGIESGPTIDALLELGCHRGQGYLMSVPMSAEELAPVLKAGTISLDGHSRVGIPAATLTDTAL